jgi:hypothetical protein
MLAANIFNPAIGRRGPPLIAEVRDGKKNQPEPKENEKI